jgi:streptogramin lyase
LAGSTGGYADGTGTAAQFSLPAGVAVDASGNVYVADYANHKIRRITPAGVVTTVAGTSNGYTDGTGTAAQFYYPTGVAVDASGNMYVADYNNHKIRRITGGVLSTASYTQAGGFTVYPNPSNGIFNIEALTNATITVFDMVGKQVSTQKVAIGTATINLSSFTAGVYFAKITTEDNQTQTVKLIKQ